MKSVEEEVKDKVEKHLLSLYQLGTQGPVGYLNKRTGEITILSTRYEYDLKQGRVLEYPVELPGGILIGVR